MLAHVSGPVNDESVEFFRNRLGKTSRPSWPSLDQRQKRFSGEPGSDNLPAALRPGGVATPPPPPAPSQTGEPSGHPS